MFNKNMYRFCIKHIIVFVLLLSPNFVLAAECQQLGSQHNNTTEGKYYDPDLGEKPCPVHHYCPGTGYAICCDTIDSGVFPFSDQDTQNVIGAKSKYECYKKLDGNENTAGHGAKCINREGDSVSCRQYYRDNNSATNNYVSQQNGSTYYYIVCEDDDHNSPDLIETVGYRGEDTTCTDLYEANSPLYQYYCAEAYSAPASATNPHTVMRYHIETNGKCYSNALTCGKFGATGGCDSANTNDISFSGYLRWNWNNRQWQQDTNATAFTCKCTKNNIDIAVSGNDYTCTGNASYRANGTMFGLNTVDGTRVEYNNYPDEYSCESCKAGYVGFYKLNTNQSDTRKTCKKAAQGCYSYGCPYNISDNEQVNCTNGVFQSSSPSCLNVSDDVKKFYKPCYAGMTTDNTGSTTRSDCHYTNDTQFCDAYGCTSMGQLLNATQTSFPGDWTWYMQQ